MKSKQPSKYYKQLKPSLVNFSKFAVVSFALTEIVLGKSPYQIIKKDTLSNIIYEKFGPPIYGPRGRLREVIALNPHLLNPDFIKPGDIIYLPSNYVGVIPLQVNKERTTEVTQVQVKKVERQSEVQAQPVAQNSIQGPAQDEEIGKLNFRAGTGGVEIEQYDKSNKITSRVISNNAYFLNVGMDQKWSENSSFNLSWDISKIDLAQPDGIPLSKTDIILSKFSGTYLRQVSEKWKFGLKTEVGQLPQLQRKDATTLKVETPWIPIVSPSVVYNHKINRFYDAGVEGAVGYVLPALISSKETNSGYGYELRPYLSLSLKKMQVWTEGSWSERNFSDSRSEVHFRELKFMVGIKFPILGE